MSARLPPHASPPNARLRGRRHLISPLTRRILAVNMMALIFLVGGLLYLDRVKNELIANELESLRLRAEMVAVALGESAVDDTSAASPQLSSQRAEQLLESLSPPAHVRTRLFDNDGDQFADSSQIPTNARAVTVESLSPPDVVVEQLSPPDSGAFTKNVRRAYDFLMATRLGSGILPLYIDRRRAIFYPEVMKALGGDASSGLWNTRDRKLVLTTAVPIRRYKRVLGAVLVSSRAEVIGEGVFKVRLTIFEAFAFALVITTTLSFYLAGTIARPIRRLAAAAERVHRGRGRRHFIPDMAKRDDEIGELSETLREMTEALWQRMDAIEAFAADVAHEIKNPLTSLRSAVETVARVQNEEQRAKLMAIIQDDVARLDRLISDISDASRVDAELSRADTAPVSLHAMLTAIAAVYSDSGVAPGIAVRVDVPADDALEVMGIEGRLGQILRNLLQNAVSFSPAGGNLVLRGWRDRRAVVIDVDDDGPGIPENKLDAIFDRFYSERPEQEKFGTHSGLGLSISRQIAEAHGGSLRATNRLNEDGSVAGARFTLRVPAAPKKS